MGFGRATIGGRRASRFAVLLAVIVALSVAGLPRPAAALGKAADPPPPAMERIGSNGDAHRGASASTAYIVRTDDDAGLQDLVGRLASLGVRPSVQWNNSVFGVLVDLDPASLDVVRHDPAVVSVEPDQAMQASGTETSPPWGLDRIDQRSQPLDSTYNYAETGTGVTAYVIDTGLRLSHHEFTGRVLPGGFVDFGDGTGASDCNGHGTHVSGTLGGTTYGVAKGVSIVPVKVFDCSARGSNSTVISGIEWVIGDHQAGVPAVANLSLGGPGSPAVDAAVQGLIDDGVTVVVSAGNDNEPSCNDSPARVAAVITVAASEIDDARASYSNFGSCNDLFAPGTSILSAWIDSDDAARLETGTSMASPHVAGTVALLLQSYATATPAEIWSMIDADSTRGALTVPPGDPNKLLYERQDLPLTVTRSGSGSGTVTSTPAGIACEPTCSASFPFSSSVTLTVSPAPGSTFTGWSGAGCTGTADCSLTMDTAKSATATFTLDSNPLTVAKAGNGSGTVISSPPAISCGATCSVALDYGTAVTLTAVAAAGSTFAGWSGGGYGTDLRRDDESPSRSPPRSPWTATRFRFPRSRPASRTPARSARPEPSRAGGSPAE
jgi:subtilisin family serine protease